MLTSIPAGIVTHMDTFMQHLYYINQLLINLFNRSYVHHFAISHLEIFMYIFSLFLYLSSSFFLFLPSNTCLNFKICKIQNLSTFSLRQLYVLQTKLNNSAAIKIDIFSPVILIKSYISFFRKHFFYQKNTELK